jgi:hypothetical protein
LSVSNSLTITEFVQRFAAVYGGGSDELGEHFTPTDYLPVIITHFFNKPIQNSGLLRKLYIEKELSCYEISKLTDWSKTSISESHRKLNIKKEKLKR